MVSLQRLALELLTVPVLALTIYARYAKQLAGPWRWIYVIGATLSLYFNVFVLIVQCFEKIPSLKTLAPTQTEPPFQLTQLITLILFVILIVIGIIRFRPLEGRLRPEMT